MKHKKNTKEKAKFLFDSENDFAILKINDKEYSYSNEIGTILIDKSSNGELSGTRVFDATKFFKMTKKKLASIREAEIVQTNGSLQIDINGKKYSIKQKAIA